MAGRFTRQLNKIIIIGAPTSAGAAIPGSEKGPQRLRAAGLAERLREAGFEVTDLGDGATATFQPDEENPRARNLRSVMRAAESLTPLLEKAIKSGGLPLILGGDSTIALPAVASLRKVHRRAISLFYIGRDPELNVPATSATGVLSGMTLAHIAGRGAAELMRNWGMAPLVREPEIAIFGIGRLEPAEQEWLWRSPLHSYKAEKVRNLEAAAAARNALEEIHGNSHEFLLHFDPDVLSSEQMAAVDDPAPGGLDLSYVQEIITTLAGEPYLAAIEVTGYNPERDPDGRAARVLVDLITNALKLKLSKAAEQKPAAEPAGTETAAAAVADAGAEARGALPPTNSEPSSGMQGGHPEQANAVVSGGGNPSSELVEEQGQPAVESGGMEEGPIPSGAGSENIRE